MVKMKRQSVQAGNVVCVLLRAGDVMDRVNQTDVTMTMVMKCSVQAGNVVCVCCVQVT